METFGEGWFNLEVAPDDGLRWSQPHAVWESPRFWAGGHEGFGLWVQTSTLEPLGSSGYQGMICCFITGIQFRVPLAPNPADHSCSSLQISQWASTSASRNKDFPWSWEKCWHFAEEISWIFRGIPLGFFMFFVSRKAQGVLICAKPARTPHSLPPDIPWSRLERGEEVGMEVGKQLEEGHQDSRNSEFSSSIPETPQAPNPFHGMCSIPYPFPKSSYHTTQIPVSAGITHIPTPPEVLKTS